MTEYVLSFKTDASPGHDCSAAIFTEGKLTFASEVERYTRKKHDNAFPKEAIQDCLAHENISIEDIDTLAIPFSPDLIKQTIKHDIKHFVPKIIRRDLSIPAKAYRFHQRAVKRAEQSRAKDFIQNTMEKRFGFCPQISFVPHHKAHAASAYHPTDFDESLIFTIDSTGEYDSTVIWHAQQGELERLKTYHTNNSLGRFFGSVTEFLGFRRNNGEGKIMGLAPYGRENKEIQQTLGKRLTSGVEYDVSEIDTGADIAEMLGWAPSIDTDSFTQDEKDLAYFAQRFLEDTLKTIVSSYVEETDIHTIGLAGGVALNCKMNKEVVELPEVKEYFIQPVANDAGLSLGAGWECSATPHGEMSSMEHVYYGSSYQNEEIEPLLLEAKVEFKEPDDLTDYVVEQLVNENIVGWYQGRMELGPRALGNRSILADPRTEASRDRINEYVKHREEWRPFAPSMTREAATTYLKNDRDSPFMIDTFETVKDRRDDISAVLHPADATTRPHIVTPTRNRRYYNLIKTFGDRTGVPVVLNTSFNDHGEPIVRTPTEALRSFYSMGLDVLVLNDYVVEKERAGLDSPSRTMHIAQD